MAMKRLPELHRALTQLSQRWPHDPLRPQLQFSDALRKAADDSLPSSDSATGTTRNEEELVRRERHAQRALQALQAIRSSEAAKKPQYYRRLVDTLRRATKGERVSISFGERVRIFFGLQK